MKVLFLKKYNWQPAVRNWRRKPYNFKGLKEITRDKEDSLYKYYYMKLPVQ